MNLALFSAVSGPCRNAPVTTSPAFGIDMTQNNVPRLTIQVVSDAICPWCWIGKRQLEGAIAQLEGELDITVVWKPFELNPQMPKEGVERQHYRQMKFGSLEYSAKLDERVAEAGRSVGLDFRHDLMRWTPNTLEPHRLIWLAGQLGRQDAVVEGLFRAYFSEGRNIGDRQVMLDAAKSAGLDEASVANALDSGEGAAEVAAELARNRQRAIEGVPTFMIGDQPIFSGAVPAQNIAAAFRQIGAMQIG